MTKLRISLTALALAPAALGLAACGGDDETPRPQPVPPPAAARPSPSPPIPTGRSPTPRPRSRPAAGSATIEFDNPASLSHDVVIEDGDGNEIARTDVISGELDLDGLPTSRPASYTFYCSVDSHREAGMEGTLTVK